MDMRSPGGAGTVLDEFCTLFSILESDERNLLLGLLQDFLHITTPEIYGHIEEATKKICSHTLSTSEIIVFIPLLCKEDREKCKNKSGPYYNYALEHFILPSLKQFPRNKTRFWSSVDALDIHHFDRKNALIVFIDDYIGTGDTALDALFEYSSEYSRSDDTVAVLVPVAQQIGLERLQRMQFTVHTSIVRHRGISDSGRFPNSDAHLEIMKSIESKIKISSDYRYGYGKSEATVKLDRTPNNTFPAFWASRKKGGGRWPAPFPRV